MRLISRYFLTTTAFLLLSSNMVIGASVSIKPNGNTFTVQGENMDCVAGMDLKLKYDTTLASPSVTQGSLTSSGMLVSNTSTPGLINIAVISTKPFTGTGPIATISFAKNSGGSVNVASSSFIDLDGKPVTGAGACTAADAKATADAKAAADKAAADKAAADAKAAADKAAADAKTAGTTSPPAGSTGSTVATSLGTVTMPSDISERSDTKSVNQVPEPFVQPVPAEAATTKPADAATTKSTEPPVTLAQPIEPQTKEMTSISYKAVLDRFKAYQGEKSPVVFTALFKKEIAANIHQDPVVALSDGKTSVTIVADLSGSNGKSPNFALNGARLVTLRKDDSSQKWFIEAIPAANALSAGVMILNDQQVIEYPLTIAPAIKNAASTGTDFSNFLKDADKTPFQHDLNGDKKYDGIDDYIFTANFLVKEQASKTKK